MPRCAMPEHLDEKEEIEEAFPDDSQYGGFFGDLYKRWNKMTKTWFAFSYRCGGWLKWRKIPITLIAIKGDGPWRFEKESGEFVQDYKNSDDENAYISRIQYYCRWHFVVQWPLMIHFHFYPNKRDVPKYGEPRPDLDGKLWFGYWNHFDADFVYWMITSLYLGRNWK